MEAPSDEQVEQIVEQVAASSTDENMVTEMVPPSPSFTPGESLGLIIESPFLGRAAATTAAVEKEATTLAEVISTGLNPTASDILDETSSSSSDDSLDPDERRPLLKRKTVKKNRRKKANKVAVSISYIVRIAVIGGFLSGYNAGVLSGALLPLTRVFKLSAEQKEGIVFTTIICAFVASLIGGTLNDKLGRRNTLLIAATLFCAGGFELFIANSYTALLIGEMLIGFAIGFESITTPMYLYEISPPNVRGTLVSAYSLIMCLGQISGGIIDGTFTNFHGGWRMMLGFGLVPGLIMFFGFLNVPESPSWLVANGHVDEAKDVLTTVRISADDVLNELKEIMLSVHSMESASSTKASFISQVRAMWNHDATRRALIVGSGLMAFQQLCGVNSVTYYAATMYIGAGFNEHESIWLSAFTSVAQLIGLAICVAFVEKAGRRILVLISFFSSGFCLVGLGFAFYLARRSSELVVSAVDECAGDPALFWSGATTFCYDCVNIQGCGFVDGMCMTGDRQGPFHLDAPIEGEWQYNSCSNPYGWMPVLFMILFLVSFGIGLGGLPRTISSEIYVPKYRSLAISISTGFNWLANLLVSTSFLSISKPTVLTSYGAFWAFAVVAFGSGAWMYSVLPETKGLTNEQIEAKFAGRSTTQATTRSDDSFNV